MHLEDTLNRRQVFEEIEPMIYMYWYIGTLCIIYMEVTLLLRDEVKYNDNILNAFQATINRKYSLCALLTFQF